MFAFPPSLFPLPSSPFPPFPPPLNTLFYFELKHIVFYLLGTSTGLLPADDSIVVLNPKFESIVNHMTLPQLTKLLSIITKRLGLQDNSEMDPGFFFLSLFFLSFFFFSLIGCRVNIYLQNAHHYTYAARRRRLLIIL